jgi:hypothetical protein
LHLIFFENALLYPLGKERHLRLHIIAYFKQINSMFHHLVFFYLRKDLTPAERSLFESKLKGLEKLNLYHLHLLVGPIPSERPIVDSSYDYAEMFIFKSKAEHDAYQVDPIHVDFVQTCKPFWSSIKIYDFE